jgi:23S rRNA (uracil1939-C5)-methyltransferase
MSSSIVSNVAFGGQGVIKKDGLVIFVPFVTSEDTITYQIIKRKKNFATAKLIDIVHPSKDRVEPKCPHFGKCGGCQLQHISYPKQIELKRKWIEDALTRIAGLKNIEVPPVVSSSERWEYRRRITLTLEPCEKMFNVGYYTSQGALDTISADGLTLFSVDQCPIFTSSSSPIFSVIQEGIKNLVPKSGAKGRVTLLKNDAEHYSLHFHFDCFPDNVEEMGGKLIEKELISAVIVSSRNKTVKWGEVRNVLQLDGLRIQYSSNAFVQTHPEQSNKIYRLIVESIDQLLKEGVILDLYSGIGITSLLLARKGFHVIGVEFNKEAVELAIQNALQNQIKNVSFLRGDVAELLPDLLKEYTPSILILNPPREGLSENIIHSILSNPPDYLFYISCMPPTLARDLKALEVEKKYKIIHIEGFDMFPQTTHVETFVVLKLVIS